MKEFEPYPETFSACCGSIAFTENYLKNNTVNKDRHWHRPAESRGVHLRLFDSDLPEYAKHVKTKISTRNGVVTAFFRVEK